MLPDDVSSMYEARCLNGTLLMCFPSGKSVVTFLILLDWKNIANMVWSGKSFDAGALQINPRMPYGLHSSLNLFPINVYWIFCRANMCVTRLGKQKARESSLWQSVIIMICPFFFSLLYDRWVAKSFQNKQTRKHANNSPLSSTVPCSPCCARPNTKQIPLQEQLKSNDCKLSDDSSADRLWSCPVKFDIGLPPTEKSTDSRRPVVEDMEVNFSKHSRLSYRGFQHSGDITCFMCNVSLQLQGAQHLSSAPTRVGVSWIKHTAFCSFVILRATYAKTPRNKHGKCHYTAAVNSKPTIHRFSTCLTSIHNDVLNLCSCMKAYRKWLMCWSFIFSPLII